jgi:hypothetical protein
MKTSFVFSLLGLAIMMALASCLSPDNQGNGYYNNSGDGSVNTSGRTASLSKPDANQMQSDLIGHSLSEGIENGYYSSSWRWKIEQGEISNFRILSVNKDNSTDYEVTAAMRLTAMSGRAFDAKVKILYVSRGNWGWQLEYVQSLGMNIVKTGRYNSCITSEYDDWHDATFIRNACEIPIEVGGKRYAWVTAGRQECIRFSEVVSPHSSVKVFDLLSIDYCEVP